MKTGRLKFNGSYRSLWLCGCIHIGLAIIFLILIPVDQRVLMGANIWIKPLKFSLSIGIYCLTWPFLLSHLEGEKAQKLGRKFSRFTIFSMAFEMLAIGSQAARGELSHFNQQGLYNASLYGLMGLLITAQTIFSLIIGYIFFTSRPLSLSPTMLWAVRMGILIAGIFALEGGLMGQKMSHTVGGTDGEPGLPVLNWSTTAGDLRIAHFFGLHALQLLPLVVLVFQVKKPAVVIAFGMLYFVSISFVFYRALLGLPIVN